VFKTKIVDRWISGGTTAGFPDKGFNARTPVNYGISKDGHLCGETKFDAWGLITTEDCRKVDPRPNEHAFDMITLDELKDLIALFIARSRT
jgi:hypothetical protein